MSATPLSVSAVVSVVAIPSQVVWSYSVGAIVAAIGLLVIFLHRDWQNARGIDKLILFGTLFYAVPLAAFGTEHFTLTKVIASLIPAWIPWHMFWAYFVGCCFIAGPLSLVTRIQARLAASLLALTFFLFVALMDVPGWLRNPHNRFAFTLALRELSFGAGALALASTLTPDSRRRVARILATVARYFLAIAVLFYSFEQFMHADHVPAVPLEMTTPRWLVGHSVWTYFAAVLFAVAGIPLLLGKKTRLAAAWVGWAILIVELVVYVPIAVVQRGSLEGMNYMFDTLMFCGAVLLLAGAMPRDAGRQEPAPDQLAPQTGQLRASASQSR